jgi:hypothetical protein
LIQFAIKRYREEREKKQVKKKERDLKDILKL